jgi:hypothetical protein
LFWRAVRKGGGRDRRQFAFRTIHPWRSADDFVLGFEHRSEAKRCREALRERFARFGLTLPDGKTRLIECARTACLFETFLRAGKLSLAEQPPRTNNLWLRYAAHRRKRRGEGRPETFDVLGCTHCCTKSRRNGRFRGKRLSSRKRMTRTLASIKDHRRRRMHRPRGEAGRWLRSVVQGWLNDHAVPGNSLRRDPFAQAVRKLWLPSLRRRSRKGRARWTWTRFARLAARSLPRPRILHDTPWVRFHARLQAEAG